MSITKSILLLLLREMITVSSDNHIKHKTTVYNVWALCRCADWNQRRGCFSCDSDFYSQLFFSYTVYVN